MKGHERKNRLVEFDMSFSFHFLFGVVDGLSAERSATHRQIHAIAELRARHYTEGGESHHQKTLFIRLRQRTKKEPLTNVITQLKLVFSFSFNIVFQI